MLNEKGHDNKKDLEKRTESFNQELKLLLGKHNFALGAQPFISADGKIMAMPRLVDNSEPKEKVEEQKKEIIEA